MSASDITDVPGTTDPEERRILLIDGHAMAFRAFFALPADGFSDGRGQATNAVYGFTRMIFNVVQSERPTHVVVAFDLPGGTFRDRIYDQYKAGRDETPQEFKGQIGLIQQVLDALGVAWHTVPDYEADDIIATLATRNAAEGIEVSIVSSDRDAIQLVGERVTLLQPVKGVTEMKRMTPAAVEEKYGIPPERYPDLAALVGEQADNLPGVPGVGPKTAAKWIVQYGDLPGILAHAEEIKGKAGQSLRDHVEDVERNRRMNAAVTDLDLPPLEGCVLGRGDAAAVSAVFDELAFGPTIRKDLPAVLLDASTADDAAAEAARELPPISRPGSEELPALLEGELAGGAALVVEGRWELGEGDAHQLALATEESIAVIDLSGLDDTAERALAAWLADAGIPKSAHDTKLATHQLAGRGLAVAGWATDLAIAEFLCRPDQRPVDVAALALRHLQEDLQVTTAAAQQELDLGAGDEDAAARDAEQLGRTADAVRRLAELLRAELEERGATSLHDDLELPLSQVIRVMEATGIAVEDTVLAELDAEHETRQAEVAESAFSHLDGDRINLGSPKQLQEVLYERLGLPKGRRTKTGYSTNAETLADLLDKTQHPFLVDLLAHRDVTKMRQIIDTLRRFIAPDSRIHTTFHQNIAATGRLSSNNPNLQNIPARTEEGRRIRSAFRRSDGYVSLMTADYSQIEMRIMAHLSEDEGLIEAFNSGEDLHRFVASRVFSVEPEEVDGAMRSKTKAVSYGLAYGLSAFGLARQLRISQGEATALRDGYFERFGGVRDYLRESVEKARATGYTETILGRRRYLPDLTSDNRQRRENAERVALNSPIQGSAADIIKLAMLRVDALLREEGLTSRVLLQVHDELVLDVAEGEEQRLRELVAEGMGSAYTLSVPLEVGIGVGEDWLAAAH